MILANKLRSFIAGSTAQLRVEQGEAVLHSYLPDLHLGSRCSNELTLQHSVVEGRVRRSSHLEATAGVTISNRQGSEGHG